MPRDKGFDTKDAPFCGTPAGSDDNVRYRLIRVPESTSLLVDAKYVILSRNTFRRLSPMRTPAGGDDKIKFKVIRIPEGTSLLIDPDYVIVSRNALRMLSPMRMLRIVNPWSWIRKSEVSVSARKENDETYKDAKGIQ